MSGGHFKLKQKYRRFDGMQLNIVSPACDFRELELHLRCLSWNGLPSSFDIIYIRILSHEINNARIPISASPFRTLHLPFSFYYFLRQYKLNTCGTMWSTARLCISIPQKKRPAKKDKCVMVSIQPKQNTCTSTFVFIQVLLLLRTNYDDISVPKMFPYDCI